ncbi:MAG: DinB family protein [Planctomycetota bacterium]|jgi:hypothetical protein|nr:DinB family protein [Planctomycetota bacterium]MDA1025921.1 DinB family protein [Planctomycetota bacterium]
MDVLWMIDRLECIPDSLGVLLADLSHEDARWRPSESDWSVLEIICHLVDEDLDDFSTRLRMTLEAPDADWPGIDPSAAARERQYRERDLQTMLREFKAVRRIETNWLRTVTAKDFHIEKTQPAFGTIRAGDILAAWCAHDDLHLRQIAKRLHELTSLKAGPFGTEYAGDW